MPVLLVVLELLARLLVNVAPTADELLHLLRGRVRVHLVAQEEEQVGTLRSAVGDGEGERAQRVHAVRAIPVAVVGDTRAARSEGDAHRPSRRASLDHGRRVLGVRLGPDAPAVDLHVVGSRRARLEAVDLDECVVVTVDGEGAGVP